MWGNAGHWSGAGAEGDVGAWCGRAVSRGDAIGCGVGGGWYWVVPSSAGTGGPGGTSVAASGYEWDVLFLARGQLLRRDALRPCKYKIRGIALQNDIRSGIKC